MLYKKGIPLFFLNLKFQIETSLYFFNFYTHVLSRNESFNRKGRTRVVVFAVP